MFAGRIPPAAAMLGAWVIYGCGGQPGAPPPPKPAPSAPSVSQAQITEAAKGDLDAKLLPPPRPPIASTPDLSGATYAVTPATLELMAKNGVPSEVLNNLAKLKGKSYGNPADFVTAAKDAIGQTALEANQEEILRSALVVTLAEPPAGPRGQASLDEAVARSQAGAMMVTAMRAKSTDYKIVYFDFDKSNIRPEFSAAIKANAQRLISTKATLVVEGHCDERGTTEYNLALGQKRAEALRQALVAEGVPAAQLKTISYGKEQPIDPGHTETAWAKNRRAILTGP